MSDEKRGLEVGQTGAGEPGSASGAAASPAIKPDWRPRSPRLYLISSIFSVFVAGFYCIPLTPVFIKWFVDFPPLEKAQVFTGTIEVVGKFTITRPAAYYIVTETGRYRLYCGLPTRRYSCFHSDRWVQGATGTVWFDETFGLLQWKLTWQQPEVRGRDDSSSYAAKLNHFTNRFDYDYYQGKFFIVFLALAVAAYQFMRYRSLRAEANHQQIGDQ